MDSNRFVFIAVTAETRALLKDLAQKRRTKLYQLVQTLAEEDGKKFLPTKINIDNTEANHD